MSDIQVLPPVWRRLIAIVAAAYGVEPDALRSPSRMKDLILPRQTAMWIAYRIMGRSYLGVGRYLDRDHTTVMYGVLKIDARRATDKSLVARIDWIVAQLAAEFPLRLPYDSRPPGMDLTNSPTRAA